MDELRNLGGIGEGTAYTIISYLENKKNKNTYDALNEYYDELMCKS